ncbi:MAG: hypothetical protein HFJ45_08840 [Clostridia bacterium]|nr:hypothetical protein [Clostridia bacterium]
MDDNIELSVAIDLLNRKIARLNIKMANTPDSKTKDELEKYLKIKKEIFKGNTEIIKQIIKNKEE